MSRHNNTTRVVNYNVLEQRVRQGVLGMRTERWYQLTCVTEELHFQLDLILINKNSNFNSGYGLNRTALESCSAQLVWP